MFVLYIVSSQTGPFAMYMSNESQPSYEKNIFVTMSPSVTGSNVPTFAEAEWHSAYRKLQTTFHSVLPTVPPAGKITSNFTEYYFTGIYCNNINQLSKSLSTVNADFSSLFGQ